MLNRAESKALVKTVASPLQSPQTEVADSRSDASPRRILLLLASMVGAATGRLGRPRPPWPRKRERAALGQAEDLQVELLMQQLQNQEELSEAKRGLAAGTLGDTGAPARGRSGAATVAVWPLDAARTNHGSKPICNVATASPRPPDAASNICCGCIRMICRSCNCWCSWTKSRDVSVR